MNIHKLHIFAKNRDAIAAQKGYTFQQLKTLEDWIENRIAGEQQNIYCDYEDDILSRDIYKNKTKFTQIKLYNTDFSFSSEAVKKAISHFFSMYVKGEYSFDEVEFVFETNASIVARTVRGNEASLLKEWSEQQDNLPVELLERIRVRIKAILKEYIDERNGELTGNLELKNDLQIANIVFNNLSDDDYDTFIRCMKWQFDGLDTNAAVQQTLSKIRELIPKIQLPLDQNKTSTYSAILVNEVFHRSSMDDPEDRKLTSGLLDEVLLGEGKREDKLYIETLSQYRQVTDIERFFPGEFQSVINGVRYCRWSQLDEEHQHIWLRLLRQYIKLEETPIPQKRKAIFEYLFLKIGHNPERQRSQSPLVDDQELIECYFDNWEQRNRIQEIEMDITLLQLVKAQVKFFSLPVSQEDINKWEDAIREYLETKTTTETNADRLCEFFELQGHLIYQMGQPNKLEACRNAFAFYRKIPPLLDKAHYYSLVNLYEQLKELIKTLTKYGNDDELIEMIDDFTVEIREYAEKTGLAHKSAQDLIERAKLHLEKQDLQNYLKALELFHRAKAFWRLDYTMGPYIICLLGISEVYKNLGMTYAAKYYALIGFWSTWQSADPRLYKHLQQAFTLIQQIDFKHGAWINAIHDFTFYLLSKREFDEKGFETENDKDFQMSILEMALIMHSASFLLQDKDPFIENFKAKLKPMWEDAIQPIVEKFEEEIPDAEKLTQVLTGKLVDQPFNDIGPTRNIKFSALGNDWNILFKNSGEMTFIAESFASFLQITLCEIARKNSALFESGKTITIEIQEGHFQKEQLDEQSWVITIPKFDSKEQTDVQKHYAYIGSLVRVILQNVSNLSKHDFNEFYIQQLLDGGLLGQKVLEASAYQRIIRHTIGDESDEFSVNSICVDEKKGDFNVNYVQWLK